MDNVALLLLIVSPNKLICSKVFIRRNHQIQILIKLIAEIVISDTGNLYFRQWKAIFPPINKQTIDTQGVESCFFAPTIVL